MVLGILLKLIYKTNDEHEMQAFPVTLGYYANTRQMLLKLSHTNLRKIQTAIRKKSLHYCFIMATVTEDTVLMYNSAPISTFCHLILRFLQFEGQTPQLHGPMKFVRVQGDDGGGYKPLSLQHLIYHIK